MPRGPVRVPKEGDDPWYSAKEAAAYLRVSMATFDRHIRAGRLRVHQSVGPRGGPGDRRFRKSDLDAFTAGQAAAPRARRDFRLPKEGPDPWYSMGEAVEYLGISRKTIYLRLRAGLLVGYKTGPRSAYRFRRSDLDALRRAPAQG